MGFNFSRYIFEELEIYHLRSSTTNLLHVDKSPVEINFRKANQYFPQNKRLLLF